MKSITKAVFISIIYSFVSVVVTNLVCYLLDPLLPYDLQLRIFNPSCLTVLTNGLSALFQTGFTLLQLQFSFSKSPITVTICVVLILIVIVVIVYVIVQVGIRRQKVSKSLNTFLVLCLISGPFCISWWLTGYVCLVSTLFSFLLCIYTAIAMVLVRITVGRSFKANPSEFKQGSDNQIDYI